MLIAAPQFVYAPWQLLAMTQSRGNIYVISVGQLIVKNIILLLSTSKEKLKPGRLHAVSSAEGQMPWGTIPRAKATVAPQKSGRLS